MGHLSGAVLDGSVRTALPECADPPISFIDLKSQHARIGAEVEARIGEVLSSGRYIMGPVVEELEERLAAFVGVRHAISVSSGTDALFMALLARGVGAGDAVFMPAFTFTATAEVAVLAGATPVFVDVHPTSFNICADDLAAKVAAVEAEGKLRPAAVIAVDLFGQPADYDAVRRVTAEHGLFLIADAAQSFGAVRDGRPVGSLGDVTATSFYPSKPLGCYGDGGALFTDDDILAALLRSVRSHGEGAEQYDNVRIGINGRLDAIQAAVLLVKLDIFADELSARERISRAYDTALDGLVQLPHRVNGVQSSWAQYTIKVEDRDRLKQALAAVGVPTMVYYPKPMHFQPAYAAYGEGPGSLPASEKLCGEVLSLPLHPYLQDHEIARISAALCENIAR